MVIASFVLAVSGVTSLPTIAFAVITTVVAWSLMATVLAYSLMATVAVDTSVAIATSRIRHSSA